MSKPPLSSRIGATQPVLRWRTYLHTLDARSKAGDIEELAAALDGLDEYLPAAFDGMLDEVQDLLRAAYGDRSRRPAKLLAEARGIIARFDALRTEGEGVNAAHRRIAAEIGATPDKVKKTILRYRPRLDAALMKRPNDPRENGDKY